jgi:hypothetical protein
MGVHPELNHTTATKFKGWKNLINEFCVTSNNHLKAKRIIDPAYVWQQACSYLCDYAADQKKLSGQLETYHQECDCKVQGEAALLSNIPQDQAKCNWLLDEKVKEMMERAGGTEHWGTEHWVSLLPGKCLRQEREMIQEIQIALGEQAYQQLSPGEKVDTNFYIYTGCGIHKDLNHLLLVLQPPDDTSWPMECPRSAPTTIGQNLRSNQNFHQEPWHNHQVSNNNNKHHLTMPWDPALLSST